MAPRPRSVSDEDLLAAAARVIAKLGPEGMSLAAVGEDVGLSAGAVLRRFGSRRELLVAVAQWGAEHSKLVLSEIRDRTGDPIEALVDTYVAFVDPEATPDHVANHLAFLQLDVTDDDLRAIARGQVEELEAHSSVLISAAVKAGRLRECEPARLARALQVAYGGSLLRWALTQEGSVRDTLRADLLSTLAALIVAVDGETL